MKDGSLSKTSFILAPDLTQSILDSGLIMVYAKFSSDTFNVALPYTSNASGVVSTLWGQAQIETTEPVGYTSIPDNTAIAAGAAVPAAQQPRIRLYRFTHDNSASVGVASNGLYRYVIVPGGIHGLSLNNLNWNDYNAVKKYFNLPD